MCRGFFPMLISYSLYTWNVKGRWFNACRICTAFILNLWLTPVAKQHMLAEEACLVSNYKVHLSWAVLFLHFTLNCTLLGLFGILFFFFPLQILREKVNFFLSKDDSDRPLSWTNNVPY